MKQDADSAAHSADAVPDIAVVVPTYRRPERLRKMLLALEKQTLAGDRFEIIVVDDASGDETLSMLAELAKQTPLQMTVLQQPVNRGAAAARNRGWRAARADLIAFTDDDCQAQPQWLEALLSAFDNPDVSLVQGTTLPDPAAWPPGPYAHWVKSEGLSPWFETCNLACRRQVLEELNGFDTTYERAYGEDADLGWRARGLGHKVIHEPDALVHHDVVERSWVEALRSVRRREAMAKILRRHPELRSHFPSPYVFTRSHPPVLVLWASGVVAAVRPRWLSAWLVLGWSLRRFLHMRGRRTMDGPVLRHRDIAGWFLLDTYEIARLMAASIRHRRLLL